MATRVRFSSTRLDSSLRPAACALTCGAGLAGSAAPSTRLASALRLCSSAPLRGAHSRGV